MFHVTAIGWISRRMFSMRMARIRRRRWFSAEGRQGLSFLTFFSAQPACLVAIEACHGAHHWAQELAQLGHSVRLIPPAYVKPFVKLCLGAHNLTNHEVAIMRRNAA
jgi:transposase